MICHCTVDVRPHYRRLPTSKTTRNVCCISASPATTNVHFMLAIIIVLKCMLRLPQTDKKNVWNDCRMDALGWVLHWSEIQLSTSTILTLWKYRQNAMCIVSVWNGLFHCFSFRPIKLVPIVSRHAFGIRSTADMQCRRKCHFGLETREYKIRRKERTVLCSVIGYECNKRTIWHHKNSQRNESHAEVLSSTKNRSKHRPTGTANRVPIHRLPLSGIAQ